MVISMNLDEFKDIHEWEGKYKINENGDVYSVKCEKIRARRIGTTGYNEIILTKNYKQKSYKLHRLLMITFCPVENMENLVVNHIDGNPLNNDLTNLEWCTISENTQHAIRTGLINSDPEQCNLSKLNWKTVNEIRKKYGHDRQKTLTEIGEEYGVGRQTISNILNNVSWKQ